MSDRSYNCVVLQGNKSVSRVTTPTINFVQPGGRMKLRDKRKLKMNLQRAKNSDKSVTSYQDISPANVSHYSRSKATTPTKVSSQLASLTLYRIFLIKSRMDLSFLLRGWETIK